MIKTVTRLVICCVLLFLSGSGGVLRAQGSTDDSVVLVRQWLAARSRGFRFSLTEKRVNRLGDKASLALLKIFKDEELKDPKKVKSFLLLIRAAFEHPELISSDQDQRPQATLPLLNNLKAKAADSGLREQIEQLTRFVNERAAPTRQ